MDVKEFNYNVQKTNIKIAWILCNFHLRWYKTEHLAFLLNKWKTDHLFQVISLSDLSPHCFGAKKDQTRKQRCLSDAVYAPACSPALLVAQLRDEDAALMLDCLCISDLLSPSHSVSLSLCALIQPPAATDWLYLSNVGPALQCRGWRWSPFPFCPPFKRCRGKRILQGQSAHGLLLSIYKHMFRSCGVRWSQCKFLHLCFHTSTGFRPHPAVFPHILLSVSKQVT